MGGSNFDKTTFGGSSTKGGYGYQNENEITSQFKYDKKTNTLTKESCTIPARDLTSTRYIYEIDEYIKSNIDKEILRGTDAENPYSYWGASRAVYVGDFAGWNLGYVYDGGVRVGSYSCSSTGYEGDKSLRLRPVVSLPSRVTINQVGKI